jgi:glycosyltransferase involved in cell wall biosynthesis
LAQIEQPVIVYVGGFELPDRNAAAQRVLNNARIFRALGFRPILVGVSRERACDGKLYAADAGEAAFEAWETGYPRSTSQWIKTIVTDAPLRQLPDQANVEPRSIAAVICYNHPAVAQARIARLARSWGAAAIADCTEWYGVRSWTSPANVIKNLDTAARMRLVNPRMDGLITTSPYMTGFYSSVGRPLLEIPTLVETPSTVDETASLFRENGDLMLFSTGPSIPAWATAEDVHDRIDWIIDLLDEAAVRGGRFVLTVPGIDRERFLAIFPDRREQLDRLGAAVRFLGRIPRAVLLQLQERAAFALTLRTDTRVTRAGFPTKYSEAIAYGTPVISNDMMSVAPYRQEGRTGFTIDPDDREAAVAKLMAILAMTDEEIANMKQHCRSSGLFSPAAFERATGSFLDVILTSTQ